MLPSKWQWNKYGGFFCRKTVIDGFVYLFLVFSNWVGHPRGYLGEYGEWKGKWVARFVRGKGLKESSVGSSLLLFRVELS